MSRCENIHRQVRHGERQTGVQKVHKIEDFVTKEEDLFAMKGPSLPLCVQDVLRAHFRALRKLIPRGQKSWEPEKFTKSEIKSIETPIVKMCANITPKDFNISMPTPEEAAHMGNNVFYWNLWESETITLGIFFMPPKSVIPLHNHPSMSVITRVLYGSVNCKSYDAINSVEHVEKHQHSTEPLIARLTQDKDYEGPSTMTLDPWCNNLHELVADSLTGCAIFDIMIPPYNDDDRDCLHYQVDGPCEDQKGCYILRPIVSEAGHCH